MSDWQHAELGDLLTLRRGHDLPSRDRHDGSVPIVSSSGVTGFHNEAKAQPPGVVTGRYGTLGEVFFMKEPFWPLNTTLYVEDFKGNDPAWVSYLLRDLGLGRHSGAAAVPGVNRNVLHRLPVRKPPIPVQRSIADVLSAYDDLIENNTRRIQILEEMAQTIYREWFVNFRYPGHEDVPLVDSELGPIPEGWPVVAVSEAIGINPKTPCDQQAPRPFVPMTSVSESSMHIDPIEIRVGASGARFLNGDTLFARITPCLENGKTAFVQCLQSSEVGSGSTELITLRSRSLASEYVYLLSRSDSFRSHAIQSMSGATGRQRVRNECFDSYLFAQPPAALLASFHEIAEPMFQLSFKLFETTKQLRATRDLLLPRLISGEVDVSDLDIDVGELVT